MGQSNFWDALAPHHELLEDNYFDVPSVRLLLDRIEEPVLVVGAGQGLIVAELRTRGFSCEGIDLSREMIRYARARRGIALIEADARSLPFAPGTYRTILYATGVLDFMTDQEEIRIILKEGQRILNGAGTMFAAFYRLSDAQVKFMERVGLLANHLVCQRESLELYQQSPREMVGWVARRAGVSAIRAMTMLVNITVRSRPRDIRTTFRLQRIFRDPDAARALLNAAAPHQPYRDETEIRKLFERLAIPIKQLQVSPSCFIGEL